MCFYQTQGMLELPSFAVHDQNGYAYPVQSFDHEEFCGWKTVKDDRSEERIDMRSPSLIGALLPSLIELDV